MMGPAAGVGFGGRVHPRGVQTTIQAQGDGDVVLRPLGLFPDGEEGDSGKNFGVCVSDLSLLDPDGDVLHLRQNSGLKSLV